MAIAELARPVRAQLLHGHVLDVLRGLPANTFQCVATSPPYLGLRDYGLPPQVWGGEPGHDHDWGQLERGKRKDILPADVTTLKCRTGTDNRQNGAATNGGRFCACGAWLGSLGLEPTPELYVEHLVSVFREVRRALRPDGVCWVNLGDSYAGSGKGPTGHNGIGDQGRRQGFVGEGKKRAAGREEGMYPKTDVSGWRGNDRADPLKFHGSGVAGRKPKDLVLVPEMAALALQADGWWVRSRVPWVKRNAMPESQQDRPSTSVEYVFLLTKSRSYLWDAAAVRVDGPEWPGASGRFMRADSKRAAVVVPGESRGTHRPDRDQRQLSPGRNRRNGDWLIESFNGLLLDADGSPLCFVVNPAPFKDAHFATWPPKLVEPMLLASSRPGDLVLDPFSGSCTTALVAARLSRDSVSIDLKAEYLAMGRQRILADCPMFVEVIQ